MTPLIKASNLSIHRSGTTEAVLKQVDFSIRPGEIVTVVGPNGSGKSSLIRALLGHMPLASGGVARKAGLRIGYVPQKLQLDSAIPMTVRRFLSLPRRVSDSVARTALETTGVPGIEQRQLTRLSGGQFQRVLLARALLHEPDLLVLDEPTQGLDQPGIVAFYQLIEDVRQKTGAAILLVSHDLLVVMRASDRVICLNGHICCEGTPEDVSVDPAYHALFGSGARGTLALYHHHHDHDHGAVCEPKLGQGGFSVSANDTHVTEQTRA
ncbi:metal ABC transporter ATP-binding protein [Paracoccus sp. Z330]|uniref:Metal ABC transporter ATP-binding protein n=1 Tax=Paracoccus onchidii TaxID=3017813 RepID=A0ABT4Z9P9_9RHOB|nr:metal ABC transporter ATP-binding protein [Paracoccus onchidii]MDB6176073.1 metal ABC transporter ATP-binding protein [Paracoccus onchidii]